MFKGDAEIRVISHVEMDAEGSQHLQDLLRTVRTAGSGKLVLNEADKFVLGRFDAALEEANARAAKLYQQIRPEDSDGYSDAIPV